MKWLTTPINAVYNWFYRLETKMILRQFNKSLPKLYDRMSRAGYNRAMRRATLRDIAKGAELQAYRDTL